MMINWRFKVRLNLKGFETPNSVMRFDKQIYGSDVSSGIQNLDNPLRLCVFVVVNFLHGSSPNSFYENRTFNLKKVKTIN